MPTETGSPERRISRGVVAIYKDYTGRGPTSARTAITEFCCTVVVHDALTKAERTLVEQGDAVVVREIRRKFQETMSEDIVGLVESVTGREAGTFLSDHHPADDVAIETVVFPEALQPH